MERVELIARLREFAGEALVGRDGACFMVDPGWRERERAQWEALAKRRPKDWAGAEGAAKAMRGWLCIPTGGSSGAMKLARHDEQTIGAAVAGFCAHFGVGRVNAVGMLPAWHVSGLMGWARCAWTGGTYRAVSWKDVERGLARPAGGGGFVSLVPTQLARLLGDADAEAWLGSFKAVLLGGGPAWPDLLERARAARVPVALSYGMTETAAMVVAQTPEEFAAGDASSGRAMPHARVTTDGEGRVRIGGTSLFLGYWPDTRPGGEGADWRTDDLGEIDPAGRLRIIGRADALIITGGEKVNPAEVEAALREASGGTLADVAVIGVAHPEWGAEVVALYPESGDGARLDVAVLCEALAGRLAAAKRPKRYVAVPAAAWPRDARGKVNRATLADLAARVVRD